MIIKAVFLWIFVIIQFSKANQQNVIELELMDIVNSDTVIVLTLISEKPEKLIINDVKLNKYNYKINEVLKGKVDLKKVYKLFQISKKPQKKILFCENRIKSKKSLVPEGWFPYKSQYPIDNENVLIVAHSRDDREVIDMEIPIMKLKNMIAAKTQKGKGVRGRNK
jgi:hypothetical protein